MKSPRKVTEVGLSSTFIAKNRCKHCGSMLSNTFLYTNSVKYKDVGVINSIYRNYYKRGSLSSPSNERIAQMLAITAYPFMHSPLSLKPSKSYSPKLHKSNSGAVDYIDGISCDCGFSFFIFNQTSAKQRMEIKNRKSKNRFAIK